MAAATSNISLVSQHSSEEEADVDITAILDALYTENPNEQQRQLIKNCRLQLKAIESNARKSSTHKTEAVSKAVGDAINIVDLVKKHANPSEIFQHCINLLSKLGCAVNGPLGKVLTSVLGMAMPQKPSTNILLEMRKAIRDELQEFKFEMLKDKGAGLAGLGEVLVSELTHYLGELREKGKTTYRGYQADRYDDLCEYKSELKHIAEEKFAALAEESTDTNDLHTESPKYQSLQKYSSLLTKTTVKHRQDLAEQCLIALVGYANVTTIYITLLTLNRVLSGAEATLLGDVSLINDKLKRVKAEAHELVGFLADIDMLGPAGWWEGKLRVMVEYRKTPQFIGSIDRFQKLLDLPIASYTAAEAIHALNLCLMFRYYVTVSALEPVFTNQFAGDDFFLRNDSHYFCLVNNTQWPVRIFSGLEGTYHNNLEFSESVAPHGHYVRPCTDVTKSYFFSSCGVITVGDDNQSLAEMRNVHYIAFALSNPKHIPLGAYRKKILTRPIPTYSRDNLSAAYNALTTPHDRAKSFVYKGQFCLVKGELQRGKIYGTQWSLYRFFIEEFDHEKLKTKTKEPFVGTVAFNLQTLGPPTSDTPYATQFKTGAW